MMNFISLVLGIVLGELVFMAVLCVIMVQPKFIKWYMKYFMKQMEALYKVDYSDLFNEEDKEA